MLGVATFTLLPTDQFFAVSLNYLFFTYLEVHLDPVLILFKSLKGLTLLLAQLKPSSFRIIMPVAIQIFVGLGLLGVMLGVSKVFLNCYRLVADKKEQ